MSKKVFLITDYAPPYIGGMETHAEAFASFFSQNEENHLEAVFLFAPRAGTEEEVRTRFQQHTGETPIETLSENSLKDANELSSALDVYGAGDAILFFNSMYWIRVLPEIRRRFPVARIFLRSGGNDLLQARIRGEGERLEERQNFIVRSINDSVDILVVNSKYSFERTRALGVQAGRMRIIQGGVDTRLFAPLTKDERQTLRARLQLPLDSILMLTVCRLERFKGVDTLFEVLSRMATEASFTCLIVGDGPEQKHLEQQAQALPVSRKVIFRHGIQHSRVADYFQVADIYCQLPSLYTQEEPGGSYIHTETMGRSYMEAMASGLPVIASSVGGIPEVVGISGAAGFLVPEHAVEAVSNTLTMLIGDSSLREHTGHAGRERAVADFSWEKVFARYQSLFSL